MRKEEYVCSIIVRNKLVNVGMDDCGQQYFGEYLKDDGTIQFISCGTYNIDFIEEICAFIDPKGYTISMHGEDEWKQLCKINMERNNIDIDYEDYQIYHFKEMYDNIFESKE